MGERSSRKPLGEAGVDVFDAPEGIDRPGAGIGRGGQLGGHSASPEEGGLRQLGVALRYALETVTAEQANKILRQSWPVPDYGPFPIPVVLFFFTMRENGAWYSWVAEPIVEDEKAKLPLRTEPDCRPLTDNSLEEVLDRVDSWYDAHYVGLTAVPTGAKRSNSHE